MLQEYSQKGPQVDDACLFSIVIDINISANDLYRDIEKTNEWVF